MNNPSALSNTQNAPVTTSTNKSFTKSLWFWIAVGVTILIIGVLIFAKVSKNKQNDNKPEYVEDQNKNRSDSTFGMVMSEDIPLCPSDTSTIFTSPFMDEGKPDFITPLGNSGQESHVVPVDHVYPSDVIQGEVGSVYAPGRLTLVWIENKQLYYADTDEKVAPDYQLNFAVCRGINLAFIHLTNLSDKLANAITEPVDSQCGSGEYDYGERNGRTIYYRTCHPSFNKVTFEAGEYLGDFGFAGNTKQFSGFDIGLYDFNKPDVGFVSPRRYYEETNHTVCFADYYTTELRAEYYAKFGSISIQDDNTIMPFKPVTGEPKCGKVMWDVPGTASGDWFKNGISTNFVTDNEAAVFIHDNIQTEMGKFTIASVTSFIFTPLHNGLINREFSEVTADNKIYCYQMDNFVMGSGSISKDGESLPESEIPKFLIQLVDDTHIKIEQQNGLCKSDETMINPTTYER